MRISKKLPIYFAFLALPALSLVSRAGAVILTTCAQYQTVITATTPAYNVQTNYWNKGSCPTTQCLWIDNVTGDFAVTAGNFACSNTVATYPSIYYGCHFGNCTPGTNLPMAVSLLQCVTSSWTVATTDTGYWNAAYDIWFSTTTNTSSYTGGAELMIWMDYMPGTGPGGSLKASGVTLAGATWNVYEGPVGWNYIAYLANNPVTQFDNTDILAFINDSVTRGYIQPYWYLAAIEAGNELRTGGVPFTSTGFSANVNGSNCGTSTPTPTNTPTATSTPCGWPAATCTPTDTPTFTPTPSNIYVTYPNPWPDPQKPGSTLSFYYQNDTAADQVQLKVFTTAYRKVFEDDSLLTSQGPQPPYVLDFNKTGLDLSNGLYYFVIIWNRGGQTSQQVMKVLIQR